MDKLRVLIAEDHEQLRATIVDLLDSEFTVVGAVGDGQQLVEAAPVLNPSLIVSDIDMPLMDGFSAMRVLRAKGIQTPFVFITLMTVEGISSGVEDHPVGFVHKADLANELKSAIHAVAVGVSYLSRSFRQNHENH
jgi:DNA-binding NarL/FixJ family response regulator